MENLKVKYSSIIPFKGFKAMTFFGTMFVRSEYRGQPISSSTWTHENIHHQQALDFGLKNFGYVFFYLLYGLEWIFKLPLYFWGQNPYRELSWEREAYAFQNDSSYLYTRKRFSSFKYIFKRP